MDMAMDVISAYAAETVLMDFDGIVRTVCKGFKLTREQLNSRSRKREYVLARNTIFFLARKHTELSLEEIGSRLNRTHTTVIKAIASLEREIELGTPLGGQISNTLALVEQNSRLALS
jgi:chromosomal replication initiator protein